MTLEHRFHPEAERELGEAGLRYEESRPGWGERFFAEVERVFEKIDAAPRGGTSWRGGPVRTWRVRRFPFVVVYSIESDGVVIVALAHTKRRPGYWMRRMG